jgi:hypothetical protein
MLPNYLDEHQEKNSPQYNFDCGIIFARNVAEEE